MPANSRWDLIRRLRVKARQWRSTVRQTTDWPQSWPSGSYNVNKGNLPKGNTRAWLAATCTSEHTECEVHLCGSDSFLSVSVCACWQHGHSTGKALNDLPILLDRLTVPQLVKTSPGHCATSSFLIVFTRACHLPLSWARGIHSYLPLFKTHFNIILPSTSRSSKRPLSFGFPHREPSLN